MEAGSDLLGRSLFCLVPCVFVINDAVLQSHPLCLDEIWFCLDKLDCDTLSDWSTLFGQTQTPNSIRKLPSLFGQTHTPLTPTQLDTYLSTTPLDSRVHWESLDYKHGTLGLRVPRMYFRGPESIMNT